MTDPQRPPGPVDRELPASIYQKRFWDEWRCAPDSVAYNIPSVFEIEGELDVEAMRRAAADFVMYRQEVCRTHFLERDGELRQVLLGAPAPDFHYEAPESGADAQQVDDFVLRYSHHVYDLRQAPLYKIGLLRSAAQRHVLVISFHHAISDGISYQDYILALSQLYNAHRAGRPPQLAAPSPGFEDYVAHEQDAYPDEALQRDLRYWRELLVDARLSAELPLKEQVRIDSREGAYEVFALEREVSDALRAQAAACDTTLFRLVAVLFSAVLARFCDQSQITLSHTVNLRPKPFRHLIGCFMNNVPISLRFDADSSFRRLAAEANAQRAASKPHQRCPLNAIVEGLRQVRSDLSADLFNVGLNESPGWLREVPLQLDGLVCRGVAPKRCESVYDLSMAYENRPEIAFRIDYKSGLLERTTVEAMIAHFCEMVAAVLRDPDQAPFALVPGPVEATASPQDGARFPLHLNVDDLIDAQARRSPDAIAAADAEGELSYAQLWQRSQTLAEVLRARLDAHGPQAADGERIAVCMPRSLDLLVALLAIWRAGAAYVPLDPEQPGERLRAIVEDAQTPLVLVGDDACAGPFAPESILRADGAAAADAFAAAQRAPLPQQRDSAGLAYLIYTSGSTGAPKGVQVSHRNAVNFLCSMAQRPGLDAQDTMLAVTTVCFDISVLELFLPLCVGARTVIASTAACRDAAALIGLIQACGATAMQATPATWKLLLAGEWPGSPRLAALCGGEALDRELAAALRPRVRRLWNLYGPTETTVWSTIAEIEDPERIALGEPIANTWLHILDKRGQPVPAGVAGELLIGGEGVARGYRKRDDLNAQKFVADPVQPARRAFRTGDLVRREADGSLRYLGRIDTQVKIRGYRVELSEIESVLRELPGVADAAVVARRDPGGAVSALWGFVVPSGSMDEDAARRLKGPLGERLPGYMVPGRLLALPALPLSGNGKVDRKSLGELDLDEIRLRARRAAGTPTHEPAHAAAPEAVAAAASQPSADPESEVRRIVAELLALAPVDVPLETPFGELGFDSIRFTALATRLGHAFALDFTPTAFFSFPTVRSLGEHVRDLLPQATRSEVAAAPASSSNERSDARCGDAVDAVDAADPEAIAVIGMAGRFPGADHPDALWQRLWAGADLVGEVPAERWDWRRYHGDPAEGERTFSRWGGFLSDVRRFDAACFGISPREAQSMDPQQRLLLETAWQALEDAALPPAVYRGSRSGVFVGAVGHDYWELQRERGRAIDGFAVSGFAHAVLANRISYLFDLRGPSATLDTACSSSLIAIVRAVAALRAGACDMALAGGVNLILSPSVHIALSKNGMLSADGRCRSFDHRANGYVRGEGVALVVLKRLRDALRDGDAIHGVIRAAEENHGGRANHLATPNGQAQRELIARAGRRAGIDPHSIGYIEAHGTGTALGDPIEVDALKRAFHDNGVAQTVAEPWCGLGSIKSNLGHLEAAAGVAGLIKLLLSLRHRKLPASLHFERLNPHIRLQGSPFYVVENARDWAPAAAGVPLRGAVSSFGFGGSNAHVIVEAAAAGGAPATAPAAGPQLLCLSAHDAPALKRRLHDLEDWLQDNAPDLQALASTLSRSRASLRHRCAFVVCDLQALREDLARYRRGETLQHGAVGGAQAHWPETASRAGAAFLDHVAAGNDAGARLDGLWALAALYLQGLAVDTASLCRGCRSLPGLPPYPFAGDAHWLEPQPPRHLLDTADLAASARTGGVVFAFAPSLDDPWIAEHRVDGRIVLAGVYSLELMRAAAARLGLDGPVRLRNVHWTQVVEIEPSAPALQIVVVAEGDGYRCRLQRGDVVHASATIEPAPAAALPQPWTPPAATALSREEIYRRFAALGIDYGPRYQGIVRLWCGRDEVRAEIESDLAADEREVFGLVPTLADAALQSVIGLDGGERAQVPFSARSIDLLAPMPARLRLHGYRRERGFDVWLGDDHDRPVCRVHELIHRPLPDEADFLLRPVWTQASDHADASADDDTVLLCSPACEALAHALARSHPGLQVHCVGTAPLQLDTAAVQLGRAERLAVLLDADALAAADCDAAALEQAERNGPLALLQLLRSLQRYRGGTPLALRVAACDVHAAAARPSGALLLGLAEAVAREWPHWSVSALDLDGSDLDTPAGLAAAAAAMCARPAAPLERIEARARKIRRLEPLRLPRPGRAPFRSQGVHLIVGGAGGIGAALAVHMAQRAQARCVLVGRRESPPQLQALLARIADAGGEAIYLAADAGDEAAMRGVVETTLQRYGALHGVVHSALVLADQRLGTMSEDSFRRALRPKVQAMAATYRALGGRALDFFLSFSSAQSLLFNPGQANYAAACAFQDAFTLAIDRPDCPARVINWGYWGEIGAVASDAYRARMAQLGVASIGEREGMDVIERVLAGNERQVLAIKLSAQARQDLPLRESTPRPAEASAGIAGLSDFDAIASLHFELEEPA
ncbi:amino acid adenylation domain-containing protein [Lysobacter sp. yr284]|uniref:non-ribosomal peptide synthetase n=1 Tax=Lysobacter sp. yr284 TaxID=1761791 RepID=UPI0008948F65|nr:non-ribosomal peptide synthetase [Lysobacter sp. yr284]SDY35924.1 amino acid adenylation domain-containing protein [Lysobacter sp. yr284]